MQLHSLALSKRGVRRMLDRRQHITLAYPQAACSKQNMLESSLGFAEPTNLVVDHSHLA